MAYRRKITELIILLPETLIRDIRPVGDPTVSPSHARIRALAFERLHGSKKRPPPGFDT